MQLPFSKESFDVIVSIETLEHLRDQDKFLHECKNVLKDNGYFICSTPNRDVSAYIAGKPANPYHINEVSLEGLRNLINRYFVNVQLWGQDCWLKGTTLESKIVSTLRSTFFRIYKFRHFAHFLITILFPRRFQVAHIREKDEEFGSCLHERYKPLPIRGNFKPAGLLAVAKCVKHKLNHLEFSIIIATKNRKDELVQCIKSLVSQTKKPKEIIVVDASLKDHVSNEIRQMCVEKHIIFKYLRQKSVAGFASASAKNLGSKHTEGDIVLFVDDDVVLDPKYIEELEKVYSQDALNLTGGVKGVMTNYRVSAFKNAFLHVFRLNYCAPESKLLTSGFATGPSDARYLSSIIEAECFVGPAYSFRKFVLDEFRFDENWERGDEVNLSFRVSKKYKLYLTPHARFFHNFYSTGRLGHPGWIQRRAEDTFTHFYLFNKFVKKSLRNIFWFLWSHTGYVLGYALLFLINPKKQNYYDFIGSLRGTLMIFKVVNSNRK